MYFVYILSSLVSKKGYVGITDNLERRLAQHNSGDSFYTKRHRPWKMISFEEFADRKSAREREKYLKSCVGRKYLKRFIFKDR